MALDSGQNPGSSIPIVIGVSGGRVAKKKSSAITPSRSRSATGTAHPLCGGVGAAEIAVHRTCENSLDISRRHGESSLRERATSVTRVPQVCFAGATSKFSRNFRMPDERFHVQTETQSAAFLELFLVLLIASFVRVGLHRHLPIRHANVFIGRVARDS